MVLGHQKIVHWKEYGTTEWWIMFETLLTGRQVQVPRSKVSLTERKIILMLIQLGLLVPEIEDDKEYNVQRALGLVIGRIYYMPEEVREELKAEVMGI